MKAEIVRNDTLRPLYQQSIQAVEAYNQALSSKDGVEEARANLEAVQQSVQAVTGELEGSQEIFNDIYEGINKNAEAAYNLNQAFENDDTVKEYAEQLRGLSDIDIKAINFNNDNIEKGEEAFRGLIDTLGLTEDQTQKVIDKLVELGYVYGNAVDSGSSANSPTFDLTTYEEQIDNIQSSISTLRDALSSLNTGSLTENSVLDLLQKFPELIPYVDMTADGFGNLAAGLNELINAQPTELINSLYELRDAANTEEERQQIDLLINSLQTLATYGDTGIEAYNTAIGTTWDTTSDVIDGVITQFENLAKVQEVVSDGMTMSAATAAELAKIYPEILTNAEIAANGQITLNEEVVKSILEGETAAIDAQIAQLEADKAVLTSKKEFAEAQLNMLKQVGEAEGNISLESAQYRINVANEVLKQSIQADEDEAEAYAEAIRVMSMNTEDFNVYVANVATDMASNIDNASVSMADSVARNTTNMQNSFQALKNKVTDVAKAIAAAWNGEIAGSDDIYSTNGGVGKGSISTNATRKDLNTYDFSWNPAELSLDQFTSQLELDIQGYQDAISNIDAQIDILKNLRYTFDDKDYSNKLKELENAKDKINNALKDSGSSSKDTYEELFDFFDRRVKVLDDALSLLKTNLDNVTGSFAKNNLIDAELGLTEEKFKNYSDALSMYTEKASEALSKLPSDIAQQIRDGAVAITDFIGSGNKDVIEAIKDYDSWADKIADCKQELAELKTAIRQLELEKFNNIVEDFTNVFDLREDGKDLISKQIDLLKEAGELIGESFFTAQIEQSKKQLALLEEEKAQLVNQMTSALSSGRIEAGTDEWLEMQSALIGVEGSILDCQKAIESFDNELIQLHWNIFDKLQESFSNINDEISDLLDLIGDDIDVADDITGAFSSDALVKLGLYAQQYELAKYNVQKYTDAINKLNADFKAGNYSVVEYTEKLAELSDQQREAAKTVTDIEDAIVSLNKARIDEVVDSIEKEIDAYKELTDSQIKALKASKDLHDYEKSIADKTKTVTDLEKQISSMAGDNTAATIAKRKKLEEQLAEAKKALEEAEYQHSIETQQEALETQFSNYEQTRNDEIESLRESLNNQETLIAESFEAVKNNADLVG